MKCQIQTSSNRQKWAQNGRQALRIEPQASSRLKTLFATDLGTGRQWPDTAKSGPPPRQLSGQLSPSNRTPGLGVGGMAKPLKSRGAAHTPFGRRCVVIGKQHADPSEDRQ